MKFSKESSRRMKTTTSRLISVISLCDWIRTVNNSIPNVRELNLFLTYMDSNCYQYGSLQAHKIFQIHNCVQEFGLNYCTIKTGMFMLLIIFRASLKKDLIQESLCELLELLNTIKS